MEEWWKIYPICQGCDNSDSCAAPCSMAMAFLNGFKI